MDLAETALVLVEGVVVFYRSLKSSSLFGRARGVSD
jgi:hypothetical protein